MKSIMEKLYEQRHETGDIIFVIESEQIPAHRCVLAALSPRYKAQFCGAMVKKDVINVKDVSSAAFKEFLQFFYKNKVILTIKNIEDVLNLAKQSLVDELVDECTYFLLDLVRKDNLLQTSAIQMENLVWFYQLAHRYELKPLEKLSTKIMSTHIKTRMQSAKRYANYLYKK